MRTRGHYEALICSLIKDHQSEVVTEVLGHDVNVLISKHSLKRECNYASSILTLEKSNYQGSNISQDNIVMMIHSLNLNKHSIRLGSLQIFLVKAP